MGENAKTLGAKYVRVAWIPHDGATFTIADAKNTVEEFNRVGKILKNPESKYLERLFHNITWKLRKTKK